MSIAGTKWPTVSPMRTLAAAAGALTVSGFRRHRWGLETIDTIPGLPPIMPGCGCDRRSALAAGWIPLHREFDGTVVVAVTTRPTRKLMARIESNLPGAPFRLVAAPGLQATAGRHASNT